MQILIVDDEPDLAEALALLLGERGHTCTSTNDPTAALALCGKAAFDAVLTDYAMPGMTGLELAAAVRQRLPQAAVILFTAYGSTFYQREEREPEVDAVVQKPIPTAQLEAVIRHAVRQRETGRPSTP